MAIDMTDQPDLTHAAVGSSIRGRFLVLQVEPRAGSSPHTILTLGNGRGRIPSAPFWQSQWPRIAELRKGDLVYVTGQIGCYNDRRQLQVETIVTLARELNDWRDLMPSAGETAPWWDRIDTLRAGLRSPRLSAILALFFDDPSFRTCFEECPASISGHHAALGGLLRHTCEVAAIGRTIAALCEANDDLVVAGSLLHDVGKLESYSWEGSFEVTDAGVLMGHVVLGTILLDRRLSQCGRDVCTVPERLVLQHLILSHHGRLEFGAPVPPMTLEAEIIHYADNASAKSASMAAVLDNPAHFLDGGMVSTRGLWEIDRRRAYRGASDWGRSGCGREK